MDTSLVTYKLVVAYDGTDYVGWQSQRNGDSVAETLCSVFRNVFYQPPSLLGVSRTDAGVHAWGQVVSLKTALVLEPARLQVAWNARLPAAVLIRSVERVAHNYPFHAGVEEKIYHYRFFTRKVSPFRARFGWHYPYIIDEKKLEDCLAVFQGTHDFRSFCTGYDRADTVRTVDEIFLTQIAEDEYRITVRGKKFLRHMIRRLVGASLHVAGKRELHPETLVAALAQKNPEQILLNAPPNGLVLYQIRYCDTVQHKKSNCIRKNNS